MEGGAISAWLTVPQGGTPATGVLLLPPVGYPYWTTYRALRELAEQLAAEGLAVLRIDYSGTGDSSGSGWEPEQFASWTASVVAGCEVLRETGVTRLGAVGLQLGGTLALSGITGALDFVVAWEPVVSGKRFARELKLLSLSPPQADTNSDGLVYAGVPFTAQTLIALRQIDATDLPDRFVPDILLVSRPDRPLDQLEEALRRSDATVTQLAFDDSRLIFDVPTEDAITPSDALDAISEWILNRSHPMLSAGSGPSMAEDGPRAPLHDEPSQITVDGPETELVCSGSNIAEQAVHIGAHDLVGILGRPAGTSDTDTIAVFLNSGSEPHVGSGRAWVQYSRFLNSEGIASVRLDFSGWGESPDRGHAPGRPYDQHGVEETSSVVTALAQSGFRRIVLIGLCAGAWIGMRAALVSPVAGVIALNPQLYWKPGDPVEALLSDTRIRRAHQRHREELGRQFRIWSMLDAIGMRHRAGRWLRQLRRRNVVTSMIFAEGDDGLEFLRNRVGRQLERELRAGSLSVTEIAEIDHSMHREWRRSAIEAKILEAIKPLGTP